MRQSVEDASISMSALLLPSKSECIVTRMRFRFEYPYDQPH
jgi:hypothetical protein